MKGFIWTWGFKLKYTRSVKPKMITSDMYERVAKNVGCTVNELQARHTQLMDANGASLAKAGVSAEEIETKTLRMGAAEMRAEKARLGRSGCSMLEGMFISSPRYKDWGKVFYGKYQKLLEPLDLESRKNLVAQGLVTLYLHDDVKGGYSIVHNPSLTSKQPFEQGVAEMNGAALPKQATKIGDNSGYFVCIENKSSPTYPSGSPNYAYGKARSTEDLEKTCLFLGREQGDTSSPSLIPMKFKGELAKTDYPTFSPLRIPANLSKNGVAYTKAGVSTYTLEESVASMFPNPPMLADGTGIIADNMPVLEGLDSIEAHCATLSDKEKWDALACVVMEVAHIDPREKGGFILTCADMDITSMSPPLDLYVSQAEEAKVDFGVGSILAVIGSPYVGREGDGRLGVTGWWCVESLGSLTIDEIAEGEDDWE
tara:strand:+ start:1633 stop:2913 length:1281 start_codon:yes stop_codon:yes gene_type:complete